LFQISFVLKMITVILTVPVTGTIDLTPIDNTDGEWVAPGYEVITELDFDPLEYVDDVQAAQAFFMDTDDGEKLRLILVGDNRILVFDEPWDTYRECPIDLSEQIKGITFSRNGRFIAIDTYRMETVSDGFYREWEEAVHTGILIEITENEFLIDQFDADPANPGFICLANNGQVSAMSGLGIVSLYPAGDLAAFMERPYQYSDYARRAASHDNSIIVRSHVTEDDQYVIECTDWSGNRLWQTPLLEHHLISLCVSLSGEYVLAPRMNGITCYSGIDGSILWEAADGLMCRESQISPNEEYWIVDPVEIEHNYLCCGILENISNPNSLTISEFRSSELENPVSMSINNTGYSIIMLHNINDSSQLRLLLIDRNHNCIYSSSEFDLHNSLNFRFSEALNIAPYFENFISVISNDGMRICYSDFQSIKVLRFEEVN
jgi:hypothetical protein